MSTRDLGSKYPPRTSSISKAKEILGQLNSTPPTLAQTSSDMTSTPRSLFTKIIGSSSQSSREQDTQCLTIEGAPFNELPRPQFVPPSGISPVSPNYVYTKGKHNGQTDESGIQEPFSDRPPLRYRHSSFLPYMKTNSEHAAFSLVPFSDDKLAQARHSQALASPYTIAASSNSNSSRISALSSQAQNQRAGAIPATKAHPIIQLPRPEICERLETTEQLPRRPETGSSIVSESSYRSEISVTHNGTSTSKLKAWTKGLKHWSFLKGKNKEKQGITVKGEESPVGQRPKWRRSAADLLPSHSGDWPSGVKHPYWKTHSSQQSLSTSEISMEGHYRASYENLTPMHKSTPAYENFQPPKPQINLGSRIKRTNNDHIGPLPYPAQPDRPPKICSPYRDEIQSYINEGLPYPITHPSPFATPKAPQSISIIDSYFPETSMRTGAPSPEGLDHFRCSNGTLDFVSDIEDAETDEDETITLKTYRDLQPPARIVPKIENLGPISENQNVPREYELNEIFANPISAGYGTFNRLFQTQTQHDWKSVNQIGQHSGRICFSRILSFLSPPQIICVAQASKKFHEATMSVIFEKIYFRPGMRCVARKHKVKSLLWNDAPGVNIINVDIESFQRRNDIHALVKQMNDLEGMLTYGRGAYTQQTSAYTILPGNGSFVRSLTFDSNWGIRGKTWKIMIPVVERLLHNCAMNRLESFKWELEIPITSGIMGFLSSLEGTLKSLTINGFCQQLNVGGVPNRALPGPLSNMRGLVVLELQRLALNGGGGWQRDRRYMKDIFGVIIRSPGLKVLRLGAGDDIGVTLPVCDKPTSNDTESNYEVTQEAFSDDSDIYETNSCLKPWIDLPVFGYELFKEAYHAAFPTKHGLPQFNHSSAGSSKYQSTLPSIIELSIDGFMVDPRLLNNGGLTGSLRALRLVRCSYLTPCEKSYMGSTTAGYTLFCQELMNNIKMVTVDVGLLSSSGNERALTMVHEMIVGLPQSHLRALGGSLGQRISVRGQGVPSHDRELYILSSTFKGYRKSIGKQNFLREAVFSSLSTPIGVGVDNGCLDYKQCHKGGKILALNPRWKVCTEELIRVMRPDMGLGLSLKELAIDVRHDSWNDFLDLLPNLKNLVALFLYTPYSQNIFSSQSTTTSNATPVDALFSARSRIVQIPPSYKWQAATRRGPQICLKITDSLKGIPEDKHTRYVVPSSDSTATLRRRYPVDDASDILCRAYQSDLQHESNAVSHRDRSANLRWINIGRSVWRIVRLRPGHRGQFERQVRGVQLARDGGVAVNVLALDGGNWQSVRETWGLKRCSIQDAIRYGVKIFSLGGYLRADF